MVEIGDAPGHPGRRRFVGRDREVAELAAALEDAVGGRGRLFLIAGEPGIGKTWLAEHLAEHALQRGARAVWGRCWEGGGAPPFWPWTQIIRSLAEGCDDETLAAWLGGGGSYIAALLPDLTERLGVTANPASVVTESDAARFYLFEAAAGLLRRAAAVQPLMVVLDDLHAADHPSMLLLEFVARHLRGSRLLVVGTYRGVEAARRSDVSHTVGQLVREGQVVNLRGLGPEEVGGLIEGLQGVPPSKAMVVKFHEATEGNPLFVREAVRLLATDAALEHPGRLGVPIPGSVRAVIQQRLAPLSADAVQVLAASAVVGREFDLSLVGTAGGLPVECVLASLSEAAALGIVAEEPGVPGRFRFSHSLMREVVYEELAVPLRVQLHRRVGEAMERLYGKGSDAHVAELAWHFAQVAAAGEAARALAYGRQAGERAMGMHAYEEAAAHYERALRALDFAGPDEALRCELLLRLGAAQARAGRYRQAEASSLQAAELSRVLGEPEQLARAALVFGERQVEAGLVNRRLVALLQEALDALRPNHDPLRARLLARLSRELTFSDDQHTESLSLEAVAMARRLADPVALRGALAARWMAVWGPDGLEERSALAAEVLRLASETGDREMELDGRASRATCALESGDIQAVQADIAAHARLAGELPMAVHQWAAMTMRAMLALLQGSFQEAGRLAEEALSLQQGRPNVQFAHLDQITVLRWEQGRLGELRQAWQGLVDQFPRAGFAKGWLALADSGLGDRDSARRALQSLVDQLPELPRNGLWLPALATASLAAAQLAEPRAADRLYPVLLPYSQQVIAITMPHPVVCLGSGSFYLALLATLTARWEEAGRHFQAATAAHDRLGARPLLARTRYEYACMLVRRGQAADRGRAVELLDRALVSARAVGMATLAEDIQVLQAVQRGATVSAERAGGLVQVGDNVFRREGDYWTVCYEGSMVRLKDAKGLRHLARLLAHPGRELHVTELAATASEPAPAAQARRAASVEFHVRPDLGDAGELLDATAKAAYKARLDELRAELEEAERFNDPARAAKAREELDFLVGELARAVGLGGRNRRAASHAERARLNVTRAIRAAMANLARANPSLGRHLSSTIRTGRYCSYTPDPRAPITWEL